MVTYHLEGCFIASPIFTSSLYCKMVEWCDCFCSNECNFWADIEKTLGNYREDEITDFFVSKKESTYLCTIKF